MDMYLYQFLIFVNIFEISKKIIFRHYIMPGYMQGSKRARMTPSISNSTKIYGHMGGTASHIGGSAAIHRIQDIRAATRQFIPLAPAAGLAYMQANNLLSRNPQGSGGAGRMFLRYY